jgi:hypothetical protein
MKKNIWIIVALLIVSIILVIGVYKFYSNIYNLGNHACTMEAKLCPNGTAVGRVGPNCDFAPCPDATTTPEIFVQNVNVKSGDKISNPLQINGEARGTWYFEASFPIKVYDVNDKLLGSVPAQAQSDWETENFVPFKALLYFATSTTDSGTIVLEKDNPSGLSQNAGQYEILVRFKN